MATRTCVFCGAGGLTVEDAWPKWLLAHIRDDPANFVELKAPDGAVVRRIQRNLKTRVRRVCKSCNTLWMSQIESDSQATLERLADGISSRLMTTEQVNLARWFTKTGMMLDFTLLDQHVPNANYRWLYNHGSPPASTCIWLSSFDPTATAPVLNYTVQPNQFEVTLGVVGKDEIVGPKLPASCYLQTFKIASLVAQLFWTDVPQLARRFMDLDASNGHVRIWPDPHEADWPTSLFNDWEHYREFGNRLPSLLS